MGDPNPYAGLTGSSPIWSSVAERHDARKGKSTTNSHGGHDEQVVSKHVFQQLEPPHVGGTVTGLSVRKI